MLALIGWIFHLPILATWLPGVVTMKFNTALCFLLLGAALYLCDSDSMVRWGKWVRVGLLAPVILVGGISLLQYLFKVNWGIDQALMAEGQGAAFTSHLGRMAPTAALAFVLLGAFLIQVIQGRLRPHSIFFLFPVVAMGFGSVLGYWYGSSLLFGFTKMAFPTALGLLILSGTLMFRTMPDWVRKTFEGKDKESKMVKVIFLGAITIAVSFGKLQIWGVEQGWVNPTHATLFFVVVGLTVFSTLVFWAYRNVELQRVEVEGTRERFRLLFECSSDAIMTLAPPDWRFREANPATLKMFGVKTMEEFLACEPWQVSPQRQPDGVLSEVKAKAMIEAAMTQGSHFFDWTHTRISGEVFPATVLLTRMEMVGEKFLQATVRDVSRIKKSEEELTRLRKAVDASEEVIFMTDPEGVITFINPQFTKVYGYTIEEIVGKTTPRVLKSGEMSEGFYRDFWVQLLARQSVKGKMLNRTKAGSLISMEVSVNTIVDDQGVVLGYLSIQRDITGRLALEEQLRQAQRMEVVGQLAGGIAHDFNNLLTPILGYGNLMAENIPAGNPALEDLQEIMKAGTRAAELTRQLLAFSRKQVLHPHPVNLTIWLAEEVKMLKRLIGENILLSMDLAKDLGVVLVDTVQMSQVLLNIAINARDAMLEGGTLVIHTENVYLREEDFTDSSEGSPGWYVRWTIRDSGCGMAPEVVSRIFEPFYTTKTKDKGTGLGLATVHGIVKQSGGHIRVESHPGRGTTFSILFPRSAQEGHEDPPKNSEKPFVTRAHVILLVEDEEVVRHLCARILRGKGHTVVEAQDGQEGLAVARSYQGSLSLVITDVLMPNMGGPEMVNFLLLEKPGIKVLYITGFKGHADGAEAQVFQGAPIITKPFAPGEFMREVDRVLESANTRL